MSAKNNVQSIEITSHQPNRRNHLALFGISIFLLATLVVTLVTVQSRNSYAAKNATLTPVVYSDALAMQYAQPWLDKAKAAVPIIRYSDALERQYAQPWLDKQKVEAAPLIPYSNALEMQYAQPWLNKQGVQTGSTFSYNDFLALFYAQPWLDKQQSRSCNGRLDEMYACQYGNWQPQK